MTQKTLFDSETTKKLTAEQARQLERDRRDDHPEFDGDTYDPTQDKERLSTVLGKVWDLMRDGQRRTLREIADAVGASESGVSARLRDLRKEKFRKLYPTRQVNSERLAGGLFAYSIDVPERFRRK